MPPTKKQLRIAHVAPLFVSVPPKRYGGTERVLDWLIEEQVKRGYDVTLFASGDSVTKAKLVSVVPKALWEREKKIECPNVYHTIGLDMLAKRASEFDIIHSHFNFIHYQLVNRINAPMVTTLHWRVDTEEFQDLHKYFSDAAVVAISRSQSAYIPFANVKSVVYHGLPVKKYPFGNGAGGYVVFIGRFSPEKGAHIAIGAALKAKIPIKVAARMPETEADRKYFNDKVKPLLSSTGVEYIGEVEEEKKLKLFGGAKATLIPTSWPEPFGLVTIESLCCGTPVIAYPEGGTAEIIKGGNVGFSVRSLDEMADALSKIDQIDRRHCRKYVEENFSSAQMAENYEDVYKQVIDEWREKR